MGGLLVIGREFGNIMVRTFRYVWAVPYSTVGLALALLSVPFGVKARVVEGAVEVACGRFFAGAVKLPCPLRFSAITFGHVIFGESYDTLDRLRAHEHVHVRQYERWGLLFIPLYLGSSLLQLLRGRNPYLENRFEREAFEHAFAVNTELSPQMRVIARNGK
jgi:hypothetical protein